MTRLDTPRRSSPAATLLVLAATLASLAAAPVAAQAVIQKAPVNKPKVTTNSARRLAGNSAQLTGIVSPKGNPTSYYFQWGATPAYGSQTPPISVSPTAPKVKVGQTINGLQQTVTYHFRIVAVYTINGQVQPPVYGHDKSFAISGKLKFELPKMAPVPVGTPFIFAGVLRGIGSQNHPVLLQASPYPYSSSFTTIGAQGMTNSFGRFAFRIANLSTSTAFRVQALDTRPVYSPVVTVAAAARVTLHVRTSSTRGLVRLYGTVTPAAVGAHVVIQFRKPIKLNKPSKSEATTKFVSAFFTVVKKAGRTFSRFSVVVKVHNTGRYRALIRLPRSGPVVSGSSATVVLHAAPSSGRRSKAKH